MIFLQLETVSCIYVYYKILSRTLVDEIIIELFNFTALTEQEVSFVGTEHRPKQYERFEDVPENCLYQWTRFTLHQLRQLKINFFAGAESELVEIVHHNNTRSR